MSRNDPFSKPMSFVQALNDPEIHLDIQFVRQLRKGLEVITSSGEIRRIQRSPRSENAILDLRDITTGISVGGQIGANPTYHPETLLWISRANAAGGTFLANSKAIADALIRALNAKTYNSKVVWLAPFFGGNLATALIPLRDFLSAGSMTNHGFTDSDFTQAVGLTSNGTKWAECNFTAGDVGPGDNGGLGVVAGSSNFNSWVFGTTDGTSHIFGLHLSPSQELLYWGDADSATSSGAPASAAHYYGQRAGATDRKLYKDGDLLASDSSTSTTTSIGNEVRIFSIDAGSDLTPGTLKCAYATDGSMSADDIADMNAFLEEFLNDAREQTGGTTFPTPGLDEDDDCETCLNSIVVDDVTGDVLTDDVTHNVLSNK